MNVKCFVLLCFLPGFRMEDISCGGDSVFSRLSAYNPLNSSTTDYFTKDLRSQTLKTLQDYLKGKAAYVTVAMDTDLIDKEVSYGMVICIPKLNEKFGKNIRFEVRDSRPELSGLGFNRIAICVDTVDDTKDESVNSLVNVRFPVGTIREDPTDSNNNLVEAASINYEGLREDYHAQQRSPYDYGYNYPPYYPQYYYPYPTTTKKPTTTPKPYYYPPYPYQNPYYPPYPPPYPPPYHYEYPTTKKPTTPKPYYPYYPPASAYYYYPPQNMYGHSGYNTSHYEYPMPNYKPAPIAYNYPSSYPAYYYPPSSSYDRKSQSYSSPY